MTNTRPKAVVVRTLALLAVAMAAGLLLTGCKSPMGLAPDANIAWHWVPGPEVFTLWTVHNQNVGTVTVWNTPDTLYIKYNTTGCWWLDATHAHVALSLAGIPQRNHCPLPDRFMLKNCWRPRVQTCTYAIPVRTGWTVGADLYIATHGGAVQLGRGGRVTKRDDSWAGPYFFSQGDCCGKARYIKYTFKKAYKDVTLPTGAVTMVGSYPGTNSYWDMALSGVPTGFDVWDGTWRGWCAEQNVYMTPGVAYSVVLWSTANPNLPQRCQNAGWDNVNYLLNHKVPGASSLQVEQAVWWLLGTGDYPTDPVAKAMADDAAANGDGWYPGAGDQIAVITETADNVQLCFIEVDP